MRVFVAAGFLAGVCVIGCGGNSSSGGTGGGGGTTAQPGASVSTASLSFSASAGLSAATQTVMLANSGNAALAVSSVAVSGTNGSSFPETSTCGATLAAGASCAVTLGFSPAASGAFSGTLTFVDTVGAQTVALTGTGLVQAPASATADCSISGGTCAGALFPGANGSLPTDLPSAGGFHGYADPSERKDPNANVTYLGYSWAKTLADGTHVVDLHLASSGDGGKTWAYVGPLYTSGVVTQTASTNYAGTNDSSTETVDLIPVALTGASAGQTMWVQAHQSYLVQPTQTIYGQLNQTGLLSVSAVVVSAPGSAGAGAALQGLSAAPEARLAGVGPDSSLNVTTRLSSLAANAARCAYFGQPALWYDAPSGMLYLAGECVESGTADAHEFAHFVYATTPTGADASKWTWSFVGEMATIADAENLSMVEKGNATGYTFFTEPEFAMNKAGTQLLLLLTPSVINPNGVQPVIQYGCRAVPVKTLATATLDIDATTRAPVSVAQVTENDLYTGPNEGPAACTYEPSASNGLVMGRKFENDPTLGFYIYPVASGVSP